MMNNNRLLAEYLRISKDDGRFGESQSIENQRKLISDYVLSRTDLKCKNTVEFVDDGHTGLNFNRPAVTKMLDMVKRGEIDCIIVKDFSRFSRDYIEAGDYLEQIFPFLGVRFVSVNDGYDSAIHGSLAGDVGNGFKNLYNSYYSKDLSRKIRSGLLTRKQSGVYTPSHCPYGYKKPDKSQTKTDNAGIGMLVDEEAAIIVKRIFELRIAGKSSTEIARVLNTEHIPSPLSQQKSNGATMKSSAKSDNPLWAPERIQRIIRDIRYAGVFAYNMYKSDKVGEKGSNRLPMEQWTLVPDAIPAIITIEEYEKAQSHHPKGNDYIQCGGKGKSPLARKLICGGCGYALTRNKKMNTCHCARKEFTGNIGCVETPVDIAKIENILCIAIQRMVDEHKSSDSSGDSIKSERQLAITKAIQRVQLQLKSAGGRKTALYDKYCDDGLTRDEYISLRDAEDKAITELNAELLNLENSQAALHSTQHHELGERLDGVHWDGILTREITEALLDCILVYDDGRVEIKWTFGNPDVSFY